MYLEGHRSSKLWNIYHYYRYTLTVSALDSANAGMRKQSSARVTVLVEDVNDNDPLFEMVEKEIWFDENEPAGTRVIR